MLMSLFNKACLIKMFSCKMIMARFLRASILQNICERLFERFSTGTNNAVVTSHIGSEQDIFSKTK